MELTPSDVYAAYPDAEDLTARKPADGETFTEYLSYLDDLEARNELGDTLFLFVMRELAGQPGTDVDDAIERIEMAMRDLDEIRTRFVILRGHF